MRNTSKPLRLSAALAVTALVAIGCTSGDDTKDSADDGGTDTAENVAYQGRSAEEVVTVPVTTGAGITFPQPAVPAPDGWVTEELFIGGTATSFESDGDQPGDGTWSATPADEAEYRTRVIVHRPPAEEFSGTVIVEWLNVSAVEASPDWAYLNEEVAREGHAYVQVSAQAQGVEGGDTILDAELDTDAAAAAGADVSAEPDTSGLVNIDPERYGTLVHPGDEYALDIFTQVGRAVSEDPVVLGGLVPDRVIGVGESQSAFFMTTYANAIQPIESVYDGLIIHSRGASGAPLEGLQGVSADNEDELLADPVLVRTDLDIPVLIFETESDLTTLGYAVARQPDTDLIRTWEVAGTAHADAQMIRALIGGPRDAGIGSLLGCTAPINIGPQKEVLQAGVHQFVDWVEGGEAPPESPRLEMVDGEELVLARDANGIALGGIRTPLVDVPVYAPAGDPPEDLQDGGIELCALFGTTTAFEPSTITDMYGTPEEYLTQFAASAQDAVDAGYLLQVDADALVAEAQDNVALFAG